MPEKRSRNTFLVLIFVYAVLSALNVFLPQGAASSSVPLPQMPAPLPVMALAIAAFVLVLYGVLGFVGLVLARQLSLPELWDARVSNRQRFLWPLVAGLVVGALIILGDAIFTPINGIGHFPHPPFPTSVVAALAAGIGEEIIFRLFFISLWTWLISKLLLRGRLEPVIYSIFSVAAAVVFGLSHLPSIAVLQGWDLNNVFSQAPAMLIVELVVLNGIMGLVAAYGLRKYGFLAAVGVHFWADVLWHVIWGLL